MRIIIKRTKKLRFLKVVLTIFSVFILDFFLKYSFLSYILSFIHLLPKIFLQPNRLELLDTLTDLFNGVSNGVSVGYH